VPERYVSYDGNHAIYESGKAYIWINFAEADGQGKGFIVPRAFEGKELELYALQTGNFLSFMSADGSRMLLLHKPSSEKSAWRIVVQDTELPGGTITSKPEENPGTGPISPDGFLPEDGEVGKDLELDALVKSRGLIRAKDGMEYRMAFASYAPTGLDPSDDFVDVKIFAAAAKTIEIIAKHEMARLGASALPIVLGESGVQGALNGKSVIMFRLGSVFAVVSGPTDHAARIASIVDAKLKKEGAQIGGARKDA